MRTACLRVPELSLAAELRAHPELAGQPFAIASGPGPRAEVIAVSSEAADRGVARLSSVAHARTVCGEIRVRIASPALERAARAALLDTALSFSPRAALAPRAAGAYAAEAAVTLDASGVASLFRSESGFATALLARAQRLGLPAAVAIASSSSVAHIAARQLPVGESLILSPGSETAFLAPLSIDLLDPEDTVAETLTRFGVHRVRDLLALPRNALAVRLGPAVLQLIARARGQETEIPLSAPDGGTLTEAIDLEFPIDQLEPLSFVLRGLLSRLRERLEARHLAFADLWVRLDLEGGGRDARRIGMAAPTLELRVLVRQTRQALETQPPEAPVVGVTLETEGCPVRTDQLDLFRPAGPSPAELGRTLAELESLCGNGRVGAPEVADDHRPDRFGLRPFRPQSTNPASSERDAPPPALGLRALRPPVPAAVRLFRGRPERIRSGVANGEVLRLAGPWRTTGGWWSPEERFAYDSFDIQTEDGTVARLRFDHIRRAWHIDAVYD